MDLAFLKEQLTPFGFVCEHAFGERWFHFKAQIGEPPFLQYDGVNRAVKIYPNYVSNVYLVFPNDSVIDFPKHAEQFLKSRKDWMVNKKIKKLNEDF